MASPAGPTYRAITLFITKAETNFITVDIPVKTEVLIKVNLIFPFPLAY